jgi:transcription elongation GreA/GreB family factor
MREQLETLVSAGKISRQDVEPLLKLMECGFCQHRGWGFGRIKELDPVFSRVVIDFADKPNHGMDLAFAVRTLEPIPKDHILARKAEDLAGLKELAAREHKEVIKLVVLSYGGKATLEQIQNVLVPDVIESDWKKWWEVARRELKCDGHFQVPIRKTQPIVYEEEVVPLQQRLLGDFQAAKGLKARLVVAMEMLKSLSDLEDANAAVTEVAAALNKDIESHQRTMPALALEGVFCRDDLLRAAKLTPEEGQLDASAIWAQVSEPGAVLEKVSAARYSRALESFKDARPGDWHAALLEGLNDMSARLCSESVKLLIREGHLEALKQHLTRLIHQHGASSELLYWLGKERSDLFADVLGPEVFRAMLTAIERDQFNQKKSSRLHDLILDKQELLGELIESADIEVVRDLTRALQFSTSFDDVDRRSLLARIVKLFPVVQSLISGEKSREEKALIVSWGSLERRKAEYRELVEKKIPANSRDIAVARSYGDLRENHEYKAAKEMHRLLMQRKAELERDLGRAQGTDFRNPDTSVVSVGTRVRVTELGAQHEEVFNILGAWDFDTERNIVSYLSPVAQALLNKRVGDEVELGLEGHSARYRIESIEPCEPPPSTFSSENRGESAEEKATEAADETTAVPETAASDANPGTEPAEKATTAAPAMEAAPAPAETTSDPAPAPEPTPETAAEPMAETTSADSAPSSPSLAEPPASDPERPSSPTA